MNIITTRLLTAATISLGLTGPVLAQEAPQMDKITVINTISVAKENQDAVAGLQLELVAEVKQGWPGFISQHTLKSADGTKVTTIEEYHGMDSLKAIVEDPRLLDYRARIQAEGGVMDAVLYGTAGEAMATK